MSAPTSAPAQSPAPEDLPRVGRPAAGWRSPPPPSPRSASPSPPATAPAPGHPVRRHRQRPCAGRPDLRRRQGAGLCRRGRHREQSQGRSRPGPGADRPPRLPGGRRRRRSGSRPAEGRGRPDRRPIPAAGGPHPGRRRGGGRGPGAGPSRTGRLRARQGPGHRRRGQSLGVRPGGGRGGPRPVRVLPRPWPRRPSRVASWRSWAQRLANLAAQQGAAAKLSKTQTDLASTVIGRRAKAWWPPATSAWANTLASARAWMAVAPTRALWIGGQFARDAAVAHPAEAIASRSASTRPMIRCSAGR